MIGRWGALRPPCADNPQLLDMTDADLTKVIEATRVCRSCPLRGPCSDTEPAADDQMQAGIVYHPVRGKLRAYTTQEWIRFRKLMPPLEPPKPKPKRVTSRGPRKDGRHNLVCSKGHLWPAEPLRDTAGRRWCMTCKGVPMCKRGHHLTQEMLGVNKHGRSYCLGCKELHSEKLRGRGRTVLRPISCGTVVGAEAHWRRGEVLCDPCAAAAALVGLQVSA